MKKVARLDKILLDLGFVDEEGIKAALARQVRQGGRLGENLIELELLSQEQLLEALGEQFRLPTITPDASSVPTDLLDRVPPTALLEGRLLPLGWEEERKTLSLVASDPADRKLLESIRDSFGAKSVRLALASELTIRKIAGELGIEGDGRGGNPGGIALPELFDVDLNADPEVEAVGEGEEIRESVLMITGSASRRNFLPGLLEREGYRLVVTGDEEEAARFIKRSDPGSVLVSAEMREEFDRWGRSDSFPSTAAAVIDFESVGSALTENPLPYRAMVASLHSAVQAIADYRSARAEVSPPFGLIALEVDALAEREGLGPVVRDGLSLALHLLLPAAPVDVGSGLPGTSEPFADFASTLELARRLDFPWRLDRVLAACHALYSGQVGADDGAAEWGADVARAAQIVAIVWYRHNHIGAVEGSDEEAMVELRTALRERGGVLGTPELIEGYIQLIRDRGGVGAEAGDRNVLLVGSDRIERALGPALSRVGRENVIANDLADARTVVERRTPAAIILDHADFPGELDKFCRITNLDGSCLLFVLTDASDPSLVLNLLDIGVQDVFTPPHDFDLVAARVHRAIRSRATNSQSAVRQPGEFSASFEVFSFLDLIQMLGQAMKSVRIELKRNEESEAVIIDMRKGRIIHAAVGKRTGEQVVYDVIAWCDEGEFTVREETDFSEVTVNSSNESILMEGCRLLDESAVAAS